MNAYNTKDLQIWENLFATIPEEEWKTAPPSKAMQGCLDFFLKRGVQSVLDVGCGPGRWAIYLAQNGLQVKGTDFSENAVRIARKWASEEELRVEFSCRVLTETAFPGEKFQGVVAALVLDNVSREEMLTGISWMRESLVDEGYLFALFNPVMTKEIIDAQIKDENPTAGITQINYTDSEIISVFKGFEILKREIYEAEMRGFWLRKLRK
jgi:cyclopropane fatty-acyl-phospholipid synthase-like methyltransferase